MSVTQDQWRLLAHAAEALRDRAYAPYSHYKVGAALLTTDGVVTGCNVENAAYPMCICAEANAVTTAIALGKTDFIAIAVATGGPTPGAPCGACRQILAEFAPELSVGFVVNGEIQRVVSLRELLPESFTPAVLAEKTPR